MLLEELSLRNNLRTLLVNSAGSKSASVQIWFKAGSSLENIKNQGVAHFLEHMFFKGTEQNPGSKIAETVESCGGEINAFTSFDYTCYYINVPISQLNTAVTLLLDMVSNPLFLQKDLEPERDVVFEEYRRSLDNPSQYSFFEIQKNFFKGAYKHPILGNEKTIKNFSREQLIEFRNSFYNLENALFVIAGDVKDKEKLTKLINQFKLPSGKKSKFSPFNIKPESGIVKHNKATNQVSFSIVGQAPDYSSTEGVFEDLALNCLTFGDTSPLYKSLVTDTNYANSVGASTLFFNKKGAHFLKFSFPFENTSKVLKEFEKKLLHVLKNGFSMKEIDRIRNQYIASKVYEKETIESYAFSLGHGFAQTGNIHCEEDFIEMMKLATKNDVHKALLRIFSHVLHTSIQLPLEKKCPVSDSKIELTLNKIRSFAQKQFEQIKDTEFQDSNYDTQVKVFKLKNNIKLVYRYNNMTPTFSLNTFIRGGITQESNKNNGVYNLIAKNLTYGHNDCNYEDLKSLLELKSSYLNGFSGNNSYGLVLHGLTEHFGSLVPHFFKCLLSPTIPEKYLELEKELIRRTIHLQEEDPVKICFSEFKKLVFKDHPYQMNLIGTEKSIKNISKKIIIDTHKKNINTNEIVIAYCGDLSANYIIEEVQQYFNSLPSRKTQKIKIKEANSLKNKKVQIKFDREQSQIIIGKGAPRSSTKDDLHLRMLTAYLSGQSSELFVKVRDEMGLCYATQPLHLPALEAAYFGIYIGAGNDKKDLAIKAIKDILNNLNKNGLNKSKFNRIKKMMIGQNQINVQTNEDFAQFYGIPLLQGLGLDYQHKTIEEIKKINHDDFNKFLKKYLKDDWNIVEVGP